MKYPVLLDVRQLFTRFAGLRQKFLQSAKTIAFLSRLHDDSDFKPIKTQPPTRYYTLEINEKRRTVIIKADLQPSILWCRIMHTKGFIGLGPETLTQAL
jgi:hypothetical protein